MIETTDRFAHADNLMTRVDPRIKLLFALIAILMCIISPSPVVPFVAAALSILSLAAVKIPSKYILKRLSAPLWIAFTAMLLKLLFTPGETMIHITYGVLHLNLTDAGLQAGVLVMSRVTGAVSMLLFLTLTTKMDHIAWAAGKLHVPQLLIEMILLVYRYVFVLQDEASTIRRAQQSRLGYARWNYGFRSAGTLTGMLFIRCFDRAESVHRAMTARGYSGNYHIDCTISPSIYHAAAAVLVLAGFASLGILTI